jgi:outer membrane protein insertion porin family
VYAFASIYPHFTKIQGDSALLIELEIDEGEKSSVESVEIRGTRFTSKRIAKHCSALSPGNVFNEKKLLIGKKRLLDLGYYELVSEPFVLKGSRYSLVKILYHATEFRNNSIEGILGYSPSTKQDEKGFFTGLLNLSLLNLFGSARDFRIFWKRSSPEVFEIRASYLEHWFLGSPVDVELEMNQFVQDSTYLEDILGIKGKMNVFYRTSLYTQVTRERVVSGSVSDPRNRIPECRTLGLGAGFSFDSRDNPVDPSSGYRVNMESLFKFRNEEQLEASTIKTREAVPYSFLETYLPLKKNLTGFMKISCKAVLSTIKPLKAYSLFRIGGTETLRGYRESEFYAQKAVWTRMELRQPLSGKAKVFMFWDAALMENVSGRNAGKHGFGIGLTSWTRIGDLEVAYGIGSGDRLSDGKIHVKLNNRF